MDAYRIASDEEKTCCYEYDQLIGPNWSITEMQEAIGEK